MNDMTCVRCHDVVSPQLIDFLDDGAVCRRCIIAADSNPEAIARGERALMRSIGRRQILVGVIMLAAATGVFALNALGSGGGQLILIPTGLLLGGLFELVRGFSNLSS